MSRRAHEASEKNSEVGACVVVTDNSAWRQRPRLTQIGGQGKPQGGDFGNDRSQPPEKVPIASRRRSDRIALQQAGRARESCF